MEFTAFYFWALFLPCVLLVYIACPGKWKNGVLFAASLLYYYAYNVLLYRTIIVKNTVFLIFCILITYVGGRIGGRYLTQGKTQKGHSVLILSFCVNLLVLLICKYTQFVAYNLNQLNEMLNLWEGTITIPAWRQPVGLSFFVFQSSSYLLDIYFQKTEAEKNVLNYGLFVSFFPTIVSGPIQRGAHFLPQINKNREIDWERLHYAFRTFLWGAFLKLVVANRLAVFTDAVYLDVNSHGFSLLALAAIAYSVQIYADFSGYSLMAIAVARLFGFDFHDNFVRPYAATSIADFWRRWHISLSTWFRDYLYIPLGGNRKGKLCKYRNLAIVFLISGLWHGASWNFVLWGGIHAAYQIIGDLTKQHRIDLSRSLGIERDSFVFRLWQRVFVFAAVTIAWVFFRIDSMHGIMAFFGSLFRDWQIGNLFTGVPAAKGLDAITVISVLLLACVSSLKEAGVSPNILLAQSGILRFVCYFTLLLWTILFGQYGPDFSAGAFIYAGF